MTMIQKRMANVPCLSAVTKLITVRLILPEAIVITALPAPGANHKATAVLISLILGKCGLWGAFCDLVK